MAEPNKTIANTLEYLTKRQGRAVFFELIPFLTFYKRRGFDPQLFEIIKMLYVCNLDTVVDHLYQAVNAQQTDADADAHKKIIMDELYKVFSHLASNNRLQALCDAKEQRLKQETGISAANCKRQLDKYRKSTQSSINTFLKGFKKQITAYAEAHRFDKKIVNTSKLYSTARLSASGRYSIYSSEKYKDARYKLQADSDENSLPKYVVVENIANAVNDDIRKRRKLKKRAKYTALIVAAGVGIGEGIVAAVLTGLAFTSPVFWLVLLGGLLTNYYLLKNDCDFVMRQLIFWKIYKGDEDVPVYKRRTGTDNNGKPIYAYDKGGLVKAMFITLGLGFAVGAGASYGLLSLGSCIKLLIGLGFAGAAVIGSVPAIFTAMGLLLLLYVVSALLVKTGKEDVKGFLKSHFVLEGFFASSAKEKAVHIVKCSLKVILFVAAATLSIVSAVATLGLLHSKASSTLAILITKGNAVINKTVDAVASGKAIQVASMVISGLGASLMSVFMTKNLIKATLAIGNSIMNAVLHPVLTYRAVKREMGQAFKNPFRGAHMVLSALKRIILLGATGLNSYGQAGGVAKASDNPDAYKYFDFSYNHTIGKFLPNPGLAVEQALLPTGFAMTSTASNASSAYEALKPEDSQSFSPASAIADLRSRFYTLKVADNAEHKLQKSPVMMDGQAVSASAQ